MKTLLLLTALLLAPLAAATDSDASQQALTQISQQLDLSAMQVAQFEQKKYLAAIPYPLLSTGRLSLNPQHQLEWLVEQPVASQLIFDDQGMRQLQNGQVVMQYTQQQPGIAMIGKVLRATLSLNTAVLAHYFTLHPIATSAGWQLRLEPKEPNLQELIEALLISGDQTIKQVVVLEPNGDRSEIAIHWINSAQ